jgi:hypothetical protein
MQAERALHAGAPNRLRMACSALTLVIACAASTAVVAGVAGVAGVARKSAPSAELSAAEIAAKNAAARGGVEAWRKIETMVWIGHLESSRTPAPSLPFQLEQKRPNKTRFELHAMNQRSMRMFDGTRGWKSKPESSGRVDLAPYTPDEARYARDEPVIDGPLIDYEAKGSTVMLAGVERLEGLKIYHLAVRFASGERQDVWVDANSFLEVKIGRMTYGAAGPRMVPTFYRDYKVFEGLQIPTTIQIGDGSAGTPDLMQIERVVLNAPLNERRFSPPGERRPPPVTPPANSDPAPVPR